MKRDFESGLCVAWVQMRYKAGECVCFRNNDGWCNSSIGGES